MKILLTGACGLIGSTIRRVAGNTHQFVSVDVSPDVRGIEGGVCASVLDRDAILRAAEGCDAIIHTAAMHGGFIGKSTTQEFLHANIVGAENIFEAALSHGIRRLVFSSTLTINIGIESRKTPRIVIDEDHQPQLENGYPISKYLVEQLGHCYAGSRGLEIVQLRYAYVRHEPLAVYGPDLLSLSIADTDVAEANLLAVTKPGLSDHVLIIAAETPLTADDIALAARDPSAVVERHWPGSRAVLERSGHVMRMGNMCPVFRIDRATRVLGWRPKVTFETFLRSLGWCAGS